MSSNAISGAGRSRSEGAACQRTEAPNAPRLAKPDAGKAAGGQAPTTRSRGVQALVDNAARGGRGQPSSDGERGRQSVSESPSARSQPFDPRAGMNALERLAYELDYDFRRAEQVQDAALMVSATAVAIAAPGVAAAQGSAVAAVVGSAVEGFATGVATSGVGDLAKDRVVDWWAAAKSGAWGALTSANAGLIRVGLGGALPVAAVASDALHGTLAAAASSASPLAGAAGGSMIGHGSAGTAAGIGIQVAAALREPSE